MKRNVALEIGPMTSLLSRVDNEVMHTLLPYSTTDTATCYSNKLTGLIYDGLRAVDWKQAKMIRKVPQSPTRRVAGGTGRKDNRRGGWTRDQP